MERTYAFPEQMSSSSTTGKSQAQNSMEDYLCRTYLTQPPRRQVVVGGLFSVVSDGYEKAGLAPADSRCRLARLAAATTSDWLAVDSWEASQPEWTPTRTVLEHAQLRMDELKNLSVGDFNKVLNSDVTFDKFNVLELEDPRFGEISGRLQLLTILRIYIKFKCNRHFFAYFVSESAHFSSQSQHAFFDE